MVMTTVVKQKGKIMELTKEEDKICRQYGEPHEDGLAHCSECPLVIDKRYCLCKANCTEEEWQEFKHGNDV